MLPVAHDQSILPSLPPQDGLDFIDTSTDKYTNACDMVSGNSSTLHIWSLT